MGQQNLMPHLSHALLLRADLCRFRHGIFVFIYASSKQIVPEHLLLPIIVLGARERALAHGLALQFLTLWQGV